MKTGFGRQSGYHRVTTGLALTAVVALPLLLSGCEDHSPVAAPSSTLPAQDPSTDSPDADPQPTVPAYETDLDLSPEETEAVEGALLAFDGFLLSINRAYSGDFKRIADFPQYASGEALGSIKDEAKSIQTQQATFKGKIDPLSVDIFEVTNSTKKSDSPSVVVHFCVDTGQWTLAQADDEATKNSDGLVTMEHKILLDEDTWTVDQQSLWERKCSE